MDILSGNELKSLMQKQLGICVSIYMPAIRKGAEIQQNQIRYKNLLRDAEDRLLSSDLRPSEIKDILAPAQEMSGNIPFWQNQSDGLAVFLSPDTFKYYRLPKRFEELVVITDRFHIKPLIPALGFDTEFFILAISQKNVRLLRCSLQHVEEMDITGMPENLDDALNLDDFEKRLQRHTGSEDMKANLLQYFQHVDRGLHELLKDKKVPLIFAGVDYLLPIYREANTYPYLTEKGISGNPKGLSADKLRDTARPIVESFLEAKRVDALSQYRQNAGTGLTSDNVSEIVQAAHHGRVGTLFVSVGVQQWGTFDTSTNTVRLDTDAGTGNEDLLDLATIQTILNGGTVYAMDYDKIPIDSALAAIFRY
ncbi:MAG TPA: hypothetical protein PLA74_09745 [Syntrophales bacterium]|nr:hypothetical protein [Syntrophales bacterium]HPQ44117.1 hypothetical protein [Syntrophales bacterium]